MPGELRAHLADPVRDDASLKCTFDGRSSTDDKGIVLYSWTFGTSKNPPATGAVVSTMFKPHTSQAVTLTVKDAARYSSSTTTTVVIK